jgi:Ser/Thr protein kinase RdoA (MazF antagonist)
MLMDDAAGGRRGLRAIPSPALYSAVQDHYGINCTAAVDLGGSSNLNLRIIDGNRSYVLRVYRPYVSESRLAEINRVRTQLNEHGIPCAQIVRTCDNHAWITLADRLVEVEHHVAYDAFMNSWQRLSVGLPLLGLIHSALCDLQVGPSGRQPLFANYISPDAVVEQTMRGTQRIRGWGPSVPELRLAAAAEALAQLVAAAEHDFALDLPRQFVHGDFWDNNVFLRQGSVVHVADFDFMGERARIDDLALTLYFACLEDSEKLPTAQLLPRLRGLVDAYESGLRQPLTKVERLALPVAMARQPLWSIGGWVAALDDEGMARRHAAATQPEVEWALHLMTDLERWQAAFF